MKQLCSLRRRAEFVKFFFYILALAAIPLILTSCFEKKAAPASDTSSNVDRTVAGGAPGQITMEPAQSVPGRAIQKAISEKCKEQLRQLRMSIVADKDTNGGSLPATINDVGKGGEFMAKSCPIGHEQYVYDPETGKIYCPHPGHEEY